MEYKYKLLPATVISVCNNLIVDAKLEDSQVVSAFCAAVEVADLCREGIRVWLKRSSIPKRLVKYNVAFVETPAGIVFANPKYSRQLFQEAFEQKSIVDLIDYDECISLGEDDNSKGIDFELKAKNGRSSFVFVTSIYDKIDGCAAFPHAINFFEMKMFDEMMRRKRMGADVYVFMIVPRNDCVQAKFVWHLDALAAASIFEAAKNGVKFLCYGCKVEKKQIEIDRKMEILY